MAKLNEIFKRDYREARRYRHGFHAQRQPGLSTRRTALNQEYIEQKKTYFADYDDLVRRIHAENEDGIRAYEGRLAKWEDDHASYLNLKRRLGGDIAKKRFEAGGRKLERQPIKPRIKKPPTFEDYAENFNGYRTFIRKKFNLPNLYNRELFELDRQAQYDAIADAQSMFVEGSARQSLYRALSKCRAFQITSDRAPESFESLCNRKLVPVNRPHAMPTTRLAKLIVGESVRVETKRPNHSQPHELAWFWDEKLVNKVATILLRLSEKTIAPEDVPSWVRGHGGMQACIQRARQ